MSAGMWESHHAITTLCYRYAEYIDAADWDALEALFAGATLTNEGVDAPLVGGAAIVAVYRRTNRVHSDGTLRTRHLTANLSVDIDEPNDTAAARSAFVVFQQTSTLPLQPIVTGRYRDRFTRVEGAWQFAQRHIIVDHIGNVQEHIALDLTAFQDRSRDAT